MYLVTSIQILRVIIHSSLISNTQPSLESRNKQSRHKNLIPLKIDELDGKYLGFQRNPQIEQRNLTNGWIIIIDSSSIKWINNIGIESKTSIDQKYPYFYFSPQKEKRKIYFFLYF